LNVNSSSSLLIENLIYRCTLYIRVHGGTRANILAMRSTSAEGA